MAKSEIIDFVKEEPPKGIIVIIKNIFKNLTNPKINSFDYWD